MLIGCLFGLGRRCALVAALILGLPLWARDIAEVKSLANRVLESLEAPERGQLAMVAISTDDSPLLYPRRVKDGIVVGTGFVDFMDKVAQILASESLSPGYAQPLKPDLCGCDQKPLGTLPACSVAKDKATEWQNAVDTEFNSIVSNVLAIEYTHLYLKHYNSHKKELGPTSDGLALTPLLTDGEWQKSLKNGVYAASRAGYGVEGLADFYEIIDSLSPRPAWAAAYLPPKTQVKKLRKQLLSLHDRALE
ncbi:MAG TPA: hypothetical protein VMF06_08145 [Candidatus Limnocylindria bacterium]|jgi:hypothetical protein|nr:hypothetical protein [Candidatus Limnocylindria bacterium]